MVVDAAGNTFIADTFAHAVRVVSAATGMVTTYAGVLDGETYGGGFSGDGGLATSALLRAPMGLALHPRTGDLYIADSLNCRIRQVEAATGLISTFAGNGCPCVYETNQQECLQDGAVFGPYLSGLAFDSAGSLFVVDTFFSTVWKVIAGTSTPVVFAGKPATMDAYSPGEPIAAGDGGSAVDTAVWYPIDVAVHPQYDDVFIAHWPPESPEARVRRVDALTGDIFTEVGGAIVPQPIPEGEEVLSGDGGPPSQAFLPSVWGIGVGPHGSLAISHDSNDAGVVRKVSCLQY
jgi:DNA-binding beta-propeller fold protein YncE